MLRSFLKLLAFVFLVVTVLVWRLRPMLLKLRPIKLAGIARRLVVMASCFMLGALSLSTVALSASDGDTITVPVHKAKVMRLNRDVGVVLIANPTIADVAVESARLIFLFGLEPGETNILIFDTDGEEIMTAPVVVVPIEKRQVTINRANVNEEATYSCATRCAAVATPVGTGADAQDTGSSAGSDGDATAGVDAATAGVPAEAAAGGTTTIEDTNDSGG